MHLALDAQTLGVLTPLVIGLVAALRKEWPTVDGRLVYLVTLVIAFGLVFLASPDLAPLRPVLLSGAVLAAGAVGAVSAFNYGVQKVGAAMAGGAVGAVEPVKKKIPPPNIAALALVFVLFGVQDTGLGCSASQTGAVLDASCPLVEIVDPSAGPSGVAICESLVPAVAPIVSRILEDLRKRLGETRGPTVLSFQRLTKKGVPVGYARVEIADAVQTEIDRLP